MKKQVLASVSILFTKAAQAEIIASCKERGITLPADFETVGQVFDAPSGYCVTDGVVDVETKALDGSGDLVVYSYPMRDVSRVRGRWTEVETEAAKLS